MRIIQTLQRRCFERIIKLIQNDNESTIHNIICGQIVLYLFSITEGWKEELMKHRDWYLSQQAVVSDESKRIKKNNVQIDYTLAGVEGSFRKLEID